MNRPGKLWWVCALACLCALEGEASAGPTDTLPSTTQSSSGLDDEDPETEQAVLYTIGPGATLFERWGHSLLCFQPKSAFAPNGALKSKETPDAPALFDTSCFDFGVFPHDPIPSVVSGSMRGQPLFVPREIAYQNAVGRYFWLDRTIERQVLPLTPDQVFDLRDRLNEVVMGEQGYPYHPFLNNCSTQLRDALEAFSAGRLKPAGGGRKGPSFRSIAEEGFTGQMLSLLGLELLIGASADESTSDWQRAAFPRGLKALVEDRLGVPGQSVYVQSWKPLETSVHAGRALLLFLSVALCVGLLWVSKKGGLGSAAWDRTVRAFGLLVATVGILVVALRFYSVYPEFESSLTPALFFPLDAALPWMKSKVRRRYIGGRLLCIGLLVALSLLHLLAQPLATVALSVALPLGLIGFLESRGTTQRMGVVSPGVPTSGESC